MKNTITHILLRKEHFPKDMHVTADTERAWILGLVDSTGKAVQSESQIKGQ